ncbi:MAG: hypothetical protein Q9215_001687 [Flavoplaca cf. flavocitrina]
MASLVSPGNSKLTRLQNGTTYDSVLIESNQDKPYILFLHGFPSSSYDWRHQIYFFSKLGYGVLAPDLLGYGGTDKPTELERYKLKQMSEDINGLLDCYHITKVIAIGHDWGSFLLSRLANFHPERIIAYVFLDVGYKPPSGDFNVDIINELTRREFGYPMFGYWHFFNSSGAAEIMTNQIESSTAIIYPADPNALKEHLCPLGAVQKFYQNEMTGPLPNWMSKSEMENHKQIFSPENGGYRGGLNWYKAHMLNLNSDDEKNVPSDRLQTDKPALLVVCTKDCVAIPSMQEQDMRAFASDVMVESLDCGHWVQLEKANEVNEIVTSFIEKRLLTG